MTNSRFDDDDGPSIARRFSLRPLPTFSTDYEKLRPWEPVAGFQVRARHSEATGDPILVVQPATTSPRDTTWKWLTSLDLEAGEGGFRSALDAQNAAERWWVAAVVRKRGQAS